VAMQSAFICVSWCYCRIEGSPISTGMTASVPYTRVYGASWVEDWGVHLYAHSTSTNSSDHLPLAPSKRFFNCPRMILLAASAWPLV